MTMRQPLVRISAGATISNSRENRRPLRSETTSPITSTLTPWRRRVRTCAAVSRAAISQVVLARGAIDAAGDDLGAAGEEAQQVDIFQDADIALAVMYRDASFVVLGHQHESRRYEIIRPQRNDVEMRELAHRRFDRLASQHDCLGQVHAGDDADALAVANEQRVAVDLAHQVAGGFDAYRSRR